MCSIYQCLICCSLALLWPALLNAQPAWARVFATLERALLKECAEALGVLETLLKSRFRFATLVGVHLHTLQYVAVMAERNKKATN